MTKRLSSSNVGVGLPLDGMVNSPELGVVVPRLDGNDSLIVGAPADSQKAPWHFPFLEIGRKGQDGRAEQDKCSSSHIWRRNSPCSYCVQSPVGEMRQKHGKFIHLVRIEFRISDRIFDLLQTNFDLCTLFCLFIRSLLMQWFCVPSFSVCAVCNDCLISQFQLRFERK